MDRFVTFKDIVRGYIASFILTATNYDEECIENSLYTYIIIINLLLGVLLGLFTIIRISFCARSKVDENKQWVELGNEF